MPLESGARIGAYQIVSAIGVQHDASAARVAYICAGGFGRRDTGVAMQRDGEAGVGERERYPTPDPLRAAGDESGTGNRGWNAGG